jgi:Zn-dependent protease with chaperone function
VESAQNLKIGLAALKQKDYAAAIAPLEAVSQTGDPASRLKAQMGLVKAYARTQQIQQAIDLCYGLAQHPNPQVQTWATDTATELQRRAPTSPAASSNLDETGFTPLNPESLTVQGRRNRETVGQREKVSSPKTNLQKPKREQSRVKQPLEPSHNPPQTIDQSSHAAQPLHPNPPDLAPAPRSTPDPHTLVRRAGRAQPVGLGTVDRSTFWALQAGTVIFLIWLLTLLLDRVQNLLNLVIAKLVWRIVPSFSLLLFKPLLPVLLLLIALYFASPWLLDGTLKRVYRLRDFSFLELERRSAEAGQILKRTEGQQQFQPKLKFLPIAAPILFTYGSLPRNTRIVVSQGLLDRLQEDEIAALYAAEVAHVQQWTVGILSLVSLLAQLPFWVYWQVAAWGDRQSNAFLQGIAIFVSAVGYGLYWLLRLPGLALARVRLYFSDRLATELTGNPNGMVRALLRVMMGIAETVQQQGSTSPLLESFDLLMPVGYQQAVSLGSTYVQTANANLFEWDRRSPYRAWLSLLNDHPPLGDRFHWLTQYARQWHIEPELPWNQSNQRLAPQKFPISQRFWLQAAPWVGLAIGLLLAILLWLVGWVAMKAGSLEIDWLWGDRSVLGGLGLLGLGIGLFIRINAFYPDIKRTMLKENLSLEALLTAPDALPIDNKPVRWRGKLLGRKGIRNRCHQDLFLQTSTGTIRLHYTSQLGCIGDVLFQVLRPEAFLTPQNNTVTVTGWFRRGATSWIEVETIQPPRGTTARSEHPVWSTILALLLSLAGAFLIWTGGS